MDLKDMILVTENDRGTETNMLMTLDDYKSFIAVDDMSELADNLLQLGRTLGEADNFAEYYRAANVTVSARFCLDDIQLGHFLQGFYNDSKEFRFDKEASSSECVAKLKEIGMTDKGWVDDFNLHYEMENRSFERGQTFHNFNDHDYMVLEALSPRNLVVMDMKSGSLTIALGATEYKRYGEYDADSVNGRVVSASEKSQRKALIDQIRAKGYEQVMEEVAYTWFNRFSALRFMEVNGYLPSRTRVFTDDNNNFKPQIITDAIDLTIDGLDMEKVYELKDDARKEEELYKYLLITQCNALSKVLPGMFQKISDYTELLFPDNLLREGSVVQQMIEMIPEDDWKDAVQIIGWLYQYYNTEKKDEVFAALKKNVKITKDNIPAATQLFTPDWIVRYMVENSLGRLWVEGHPNDDLKSKWDYYLEEAEQEESVQTQLAEIRKEYANLKPEDIRVIDPCSGSGHILAYLFDVLMQIYDSYGYTTREAVDSIVTNNIYGLDIDERAAQLAYFAVMMKARQYDSRFLKRTNDEGNPAVPQPHVFAIEESNNIDSFTIEYFCNGNPLITENIDILIKTMKDAKEFGSLVEIEGLDFNILYKRIDEIKNDSNLSREAVLKFIVPVINVAFVLSKKYNVGFIVMTRERFMILHDMWKKN